MSPIEKIQMALDAQMVDVEFDAMNGMLDIHIIAHGVEWKKKMAHDTTDVEIIDAFIDENNITRQ